MQSNLDIRLREAVIKITDQELKDLLVEAANFVKFFTTDTRTLKDCIARFDNGAYFKNVPNI